jgi:hypothetical protein
MSLKVAFESGIFLRRPWSSFHVCFVTTRSSPHFFLLTIHSLSLLQQQATYLQAKNREREIEREERGGGGGELRHANA